MGLLNVANRKVWGQGQYRDKPSSISGLLSIQARVTGSGLTDLSAFRLFPGVYC